MLKKVCTWIYIQFMYSIFANLLEFINSQPQNDQTQTQSKIDTCLYITETRYL